MKFEFFTIDMSRDEVALCRVAEPLWGDVPPVKVGANRMKKPEWTRVLMSLESLVTKVTHRKAAGVLASKIYAETHKRSDDVVDEPDPKPAVKAVKERQASLFDE